MSNNKKTNYNNPFRETRSYIQIIYEDSAPPNVVDILKAEVDKGRLRYFILSPWHNRDKITEDDKDEYLMSLQSITQKEFAEEVERKIQERLQQPTNVFTYEQIRDEIFGEIYRQNLKVENIVGQYKKNHRHLIGELKSSMQLQYANNYFQKLTNGSFVKMRENLRGAVRYLPHLDEDPSKKAIYDPKEIIVYGDIKIDRFLKEEDKSMSATMAWYELSEMIDKEKILSMGEFERCLKKQDMDLQIQVQKNMNLRMRCRDYIISNAKDAAEERIRRESQRFDKEIALKEAKMRCGKNATVMAINVEANRIYEAETGIKNGIVNLENFDEEEKKYYESREREKKLRGRD